MYYYSPTRTRSRSRLHFRTDVRECSASRVSRIPRVPPGGYRGISLERLFALSFSLSSVRRPMHKHGADKHRAGTYSFFPSFPPFFFLHFASAEICCSYLHRVAREVEKQACLPTDGQKEIFIWSPRFQERMRVLRRASSAHARTVSRWWRYYILERLLFFFALVVCELGIKGPGTKAAKMAGRGERGPPSAPQRVLELSKGKHCAAKRRKRAGGGKRGPWRMCKV